MEYTIMAYAYLCGSWQSPIHEDELQQLYRAEVIASVFNSTLCLRSLLSSPLTMYYNSQKSKITRNLYCRKSKHF